MVDGEYALNPRSFEPFDQCKGGKAEPIDLVRGVGPAFYINVTGGGTGSAQGDIGTGTNGTDYAFPIFNENPSFKFDLTGDYVTNVVGDEDVNITNSQTTTVPDLTEKANTITNTASSTITNTASNRITNQANILENNACEQLTLVATTIIESTCLLLQNIQDTQMTVTPCSVCGSLPQPDSDGNYNIDDFIDEE